MKRYALGQWTRAFDDVPPAMERAAVLALREHGEVVMAASKRIVPFVTGALQGSGRVGTVVVANRQAVLVLSYGGPAAPYAFLVHERLTVFHKAPTQAKYLEQPMLELAPLFQPRLAAAVKRETERAA